MAKYNNEFVTPSTPRMGNAFTRTIGSLTLKAMGWKMVGKLPDEKKLIVIGAPHTSNWDLILAMGSMLNVGLRFSWMMKKEAFFWPLGPLWKALGGIPITRSAKNDITAQMSAWFEKNDNVWLGITPEGTRSKVDRFKIGYIRIAQAANIPIFLIGIDSERKEVNLDKVWEFTSKDLDVENRLIKAYFDERYVGINPKK